MKKAIAVIAAISSLTAVASPKASNRDVALLPADARNIEIDYVQWAKVSTDEVTWTEKVCTRDDTFETCEDVNHYAQVPMVKLAVAYNSRKEEHTETDMASDQTIRTDRNTAIFYFQPSEFSADEIKAIRKFSLLDNGHPALARKLFKLSQTRTTAAQTVVDSEKSDTCEVFDGDNYKVDPFCKPVTVYKKVRVPLIQIRASRIK